MGIGSVVPGEGDEPRTRCLLPGTVPSGEDSAAKSSTLHGRCLLHSLELGWALAEQVHTPVELGVAVSHISSTVPLFQ